jgi:nitrogen-specific signal transduction histidine kinase
MWCLEAEVPVGRERGRLVAGRGTPLDPETDRVLVRTAANRVGTTMETAEVLDAARRKDEFLAMWSHELRSPLAPILTAAELLARHPVAAREQQIIERHTRHLTRLVDDLLDISRVTLGHLELRSEHVSLALVLERAGEIAAPLVARHRHKWNVGSAAGIAVQGDPVRLAQILGNLLTNAAKFTPAGGQIDVVIETSPSRVRVAVRDNGRGIAREHLAQILEPFVQVQPEPQALRGGLGLGLAIVRSLVEQHGGTIAAHSDGAGRGATFAIDLPTVATAPKPVVPSAPRSSEARDGLRVLIVDDNPDLAELMSEALSYSGYRTAVVHDGEAALAKWSEFLPHAGVLDVGLPELDGYALAKALRAAHGPEPTLVAVTGCRRSRSDSGSEDRETALRSRRR